MRFSEQDKKHVLKTRFMSAGYWIMDHNKIVMPLVLVVCVLITIIVAVTANQKETLDKEAEQAAAVTAENEEAMEEETEVLQFDLEENAHPEINQVVRTYYDAQAEGNIEVITSLNTRLNEIETIRVQELSKYIDSYPVLDVYTKPGMEENAYVAYVYSEVLFSDAEEALPGMQTYYIGLNENGEYFINDGTYDDTIWDYIKEITLQDDVVDLNNRVAVAYNEMLAENEELNEFVAYLKEKINEEVGETLALAEAEETQNDVIPEAEQEEETEQESGQRVIKTVRATDVVNIRSSDSEEADRLDKAQIGQEFTLLEEKGNGWSKIQYNDREAYIKSDYLEVVVETEQSETGVDSTDDIQEASVSNSGVQASGTETVEVTESVRVRKSASTSSEALGTVYAGDKLQLVMKQADGWTKVIYDGQTAYVKSEYVK